MNMLLLLGAFNLITNVFGEGFNGNCTELSSKGCYKCIYESYDADASSSTCKWIPSKGQCKDKSSESSYESYKYSYQCCEVYTDCNTCVTEQDGCSWSTYADPPCSATQYSSRRKLSLLDETRRELATADVCTASTSSDESISSEWWFALLLVGVIGLLLWPLVSLGLYWDEVDQYAADYADKHLPVSKDKGDGHHHAVHNQKSHAFLYFGESSDSNTDVEDAHGHTPGAGVHSAPQTKRRPEPNHYTPKTQQKSRDTKPRPQHPKPTHTEEYYSDTESGYSDHDHVPKQKRVPYSNPYSTPSGLYNSQYSLTGPMPPQAGYSPFGTPFPRHVPMMPMLVGQHPPPPMMPQGVFTPGMTPGGFTPGGPPYHHTPGGPTPGMYPPNPMPPSGIYPPNAMPPQITQGGLMPPPGFMQQPPFPQPPPPGHWPYPSHSRRFNNKSYATTQHSMTPGAVEDHRAYSAATSGTTPDSETMSEQVEEISMYSHWNYDEETDHGPKHWRLFYSNAGGLFQSPINIETSNTDLIAHALKTINNRWKDKFTVAEFRHFVDELGLKNIHDEDIDAIFEKLGDDSGTYLLVNQEEAISEIMPDIMKQQMENTIVETLNTLTLSSNQPKVRLKMTADVYGIDRARFIHFREPIRRGIASILPLLDPRRIKLGVQDCMEGVEVLIDIDTDSESFAREIKDSIDGMEAELGQEIEQECTDEGLSIEVIRFTQPMIDAHTTRSGRELVNDEEFGNLIQYLHLQMSRGEVKHMFELMDRDGSGDLDHEEIVNELVPRLIVQLRFQEITRALNLVHSEVDDVLNRRELEELIHHLGLNMPSEEIDKIFMELDFSKRGVIARTNAIHGALLSRFRYKRLRMKVSNGSLSIHYGTVKATLVNGNFAPEWLVAPGCHIEHHHIRYDLEKIEYRIRSEHTLNGHHSQLELQFVHKAEHSQRFAILAILFNLGTKNSPDFFVEELAAELEPLLEDERHECEVDLSKLTDYMHAHYCHYEGSMTHPPCTENVLWFVNLTVYHLSPKQYEKFHNCLASTSNNRPTQPFHDRVLTIIA